MEFKQNLIFIGIKNIFHDLEIGLRYHYDEETASNGKTVIVLQMVLRI